jgi:hypothetical protein
MRYEGLRIAHIAQASFCDPTIVSEFRLTLSSLPDFSANGPHVLEEEYGYTSPEKSYFGADELPFSYHCRSRQASLPPITSCDIGISGSLASGPVAFVLRSLKPKFA